VGAGAAPTITTPLSDSRPAVGRQAQWRASHAHTRAMIDGSTDPKEGLMTIVRLMVSMTVTDVESAVAWYTKVFGTEPDAHPMDGLFEWHLDGHFGVQVWQDADRAGRSGMTVDESDLDGRLASLAAAGIKNNGIQDATSSRILPIEDPDGNQIVFTGT